MRNPTKRGQEIRAFIVHEVPNHPRDLVKAVCKRFGITRQGVNRYIRELVAKGDIVAEGNTSHRRYSLRTLRKKTSALPLSGLEEDVVWRSEVAPVLAHLPNNVLDTWHYCFSEMVNNAIDHSNGSMLTVRIDMNALLTEISVGDDGIGIFRKIKNEWQLEDERHAVLELAKGKLTTDPERHTGEGIFFTSRMLDDFAILSGDVIFTHKHGEDQDWISQREGPRAGTWVFMLLSNHSKRTAQEVFDRFASEEEDYGFTKTVVPVRLARHGIEKLVSRSQAKRLLARIDRFNVVIFDFTGVESISPAFADEIFRVFARSNPSIRLIPINEVPAVQRMIRRAQHAASNVVQQIAQPEDGQVSSEVVAAEEPPSGT